MAGVCYGPFKNVNIFGLLNLDPRHLRGLPNDTVLKKFRGAYLRAISLFHPDKPGVTNLEHSQQLNGLKDFLCDFKCVDPTRVTKLVETGCQNWRSTDACWHRKSSAPRRTTSRPGSSPSNPVIIDVHGTNTTSHLGSFSNPIVLDAFEIGAASSEQERKASKPARCRKKRRTYPRRTGKDYDPSSGFKWRPAPYADQSDVESVWEADWDSDDHL